MRSSHFIITVLLVACSAVSAAGVPLKPMPHHYNRLVTGSPFTIKPTVERGPAASPLEREWMLGSIRPSGNGYSVTLINKKDRKERIRFIPGFSAGDFKLLEVKQDSQSNKLSKVLVSKGGQQGWIGYDEKLIKVRPSAGSKGSAKKTTSKKPSSRRGSPPIPGKSRSTTAPRVRHVPRK